jgi:hypothetical protein
MPNEERNAAPELRPPKSSSALLGGAKAIRPTGEIALGRVRRLPVADAVRNRKAALAKERSEDGDDAGCDGQNDGFIIDVDPEGAARLLSGASLHAAQWIANADDPAATSKRAVKAFKALLDGLLIEAAKPSRR